MRLHTSGVLGGYVPTSMIEQPVTPASSPELLCPISCERPGPPPPSAALPGPWLLCPLNCARQGPLAPSAALSGYLLCHPSLSVARGRVLAPPPQRRQVTRQCRHCVAPPARPVLQRLRPACGQPGVSVQCTSQGACSIEKQRRQAGRWVNSSLLLKQFHNAICLGCHKVVVGESAASSARKVKKDINHPSRTRIQAGAATPKRPRCCTWP